MAIIKGRWKLSDGRLVKPAGVSAKFRAWKRSRSRSRKITVARRGHIPREVIVERRKP